MNNPAARQLLFAAAASGAISLTAATPVFASSINISPEGYIYTLKNVPQVLGQTTAGKQGETSADPVKTRTTEQVRTNINTDAEQVEFRATQENTIRVQTAPTQTTVAAPLAEEDEVVFIQKVATGEAKTRITARDQNKYMITNGVAAKIGTPLSFNLETNEMIVTTPAGSKTVAVLPDQALQTARLETEDPQRHIELVDYKDSPTYTVTGQANKKLLGLFPVSLDKTVYVSAVSGNIVNTEIKGFAKFLDLISF